MAGGGNCPVVAIKLSGSTPADTWSEGKLLGGDVVLQVSSDTGVMLVAPFAGGKSGLIRELKKLYNASGGIKVKVKRGSSVIEVRAKVAVDESSLLKKTYVLTSANDSNHIATLVDAMEQDCLLLQAQACLATVVSTALVQSQRIRACTDRHFTMFTQAPVKMKGTTFKCLALTATLLICFTLVADCYDPLDPNGNITIKWDINSRTLDSYVATVTIFNWQQYRHVSAPGWILGWQWTKKEVIWNMVGAQATARGDCSAFHSEPIPHSCAHNPNVVDLLPGVPHNQQFSNCCRGGVISSYAQDPQTAVSAFQITVGNTGTSNTTPENFSFKTPDPGYSCGLATIVPSSQFYSADNRRVTQAFMTWNVTCTYLQTLAQRAPTCCVSFSTFYNPHITPCAECACACASNSTVAGLNGASESTNTCIDPSTQYDDLSGISRGGRSHSTAAFQPNICIAPETCVQ